MNCKRKQTEKKTLKYNHGYAVAKSKGEARRFFVWQWIIKTGSQVSTYSQISQLSVFPSQTKNRLNKKQEI